ncbi:MAG TPA: DNA-3-methyladenine glycosylase I [Chitinophagaceae bacterium]|nr:DNA-3-methyladenine glycosylase I [Chitinophagaceae bacterium]
MNPKSYCAAVAKMDAGSVHHRYHDTAYGFPIHDDDELFGRLLLEINQAGLSWTTILNKEQNFRKAYDGFSIKKISAYTQKDKQRLMTDAGIIRNRLKIEAAIYNSLVVLQLQKDFGSFKRWLDSHHPKTKEEWMKIFKKTFRFTGGEIVNEFLLSTGYLPGAHDPACPVYAEIQKANPKWMEK